MISGRIAVTMTLGVLVSLFSSAGCGRNRDLAAFERTPARAARGRYLAWGPPHCVRCHSETDPERHPIPGREFAGKDVDGRVTPNLTPDPETGAGEWTDHQFVRAIRQGIGHDGRHLSPPMPWNLLSILTDEDVASLVVYLRSLPPVRNPLPARAIEDTEGIRDRLALAPPVAPATGEFLDDPVRRGEYLARIGDCVTCHTPLDVQGHHMVSYRFGGGLGDAGPAPNITFDPSGIAFYDESLFIQTMHSGKVGGVRQLKDSMPWWYIGSLTDDDLRALFAYLKALPPVKHRVNTRDEETRCPICGQEHGLGILNVTGPLTVPSH